MHIFKGTHGVVIPLQASFCYRARDPHMRAALVCYIF